MHINEVNEFLTTYNATAHFYKEHGAPQVVVAMLMDTRDGTITLSSTASTIELAAKELRKSVDDAKKFKPFNQNKDWNKKQGG